VNLQIAQCDVLLAVIGKNWIDARDAAGSRCLDNLYDYVRVEIEAALRLGKLVIPVLIDDVEMPRAEQLPETLKPLAHRNAVRVTHERFKSDPQGLVRALGAVLHVTPGHRRQ
jgi:hypothetical protein